MTPSPDEKDRICKNDCQYCAAKGCPICSLPAAPAQEPKP
jgi:hypothetical protein